jgi:hypothetical protein
VGSLAPKTGDRTSGATGLEPATSGVTGRSSAKVPKLKLGQMRRWRAMGLRLPLDELKRAEPHCRTPQDAAEERARTVSRGRVCVRTYVRAPRRSGDEIPANRMGRAGFEPATLGLKSRQLSCIFLRELEKCCKSNQARLQQAESERILRRQACTRIRTASNRLMRPCSAARLASPTTGALTVRRPGESGDRLAKTKLVGAAT